MLNYLGLKNFILVRNLEIYPGKGLQILSGETGAGKSVIVGALHLIMGAQLRGEVAGDKTKPVVLNASFDIDKKNEALIKLIEKYETDISENELFFSREIQPDGRSATFLNGRKVTNAIVKEFRDCLFDFHSQRDQQQLLNEDIQLLYLDRYAGLEKEVEEFRELYQSYHSLLSELKRLEREEKKTEDLIKLYEYQIEEIESLSLQINEENELESEFQILNHAQEIIDSNYDLKSVLYDNENSIYDQISRFSSNFEKFENDNANIAELSNSLRAALANFDDIIQACRHIQNTVSLDEARLIEVDNRLKQIHQIKQKYKKSLAEIIEYGKEMKTFIKKHDSLKDEIKIAEQNLLKTGNQVVSKSEVLSAKRKRMAEQFSKEIENNLKMLAISDASVKIKVDKKEDICDDIVNKIKNIRETGQDSVEFLFNANKGSSLQSLKISASGGELSRLLLVVKKILSEKLPPQTIIFDEIDSGIGGKTADSLGLFIGNIGKYHQVLCITHLAQVASYADKHFKIEKKSLSERTEIEVFELDQHERVNEIARMLSGHLSETAINHAKELLNKD